MYSLHCQLFQGSLNDDDQLMVLMPPAESWAALDTRVCRDTSQGDTCQVSAAATSSFLATWRGDPNFLRGVSGLVKEFAAVSPLTACVTRNLVQTLRRAFDDDHDGGVTAAESAVLVSTVAASPATAVLRLGHVLGLVSTPRYIGSCGRLAVARGGLASLRDWVGSEWAVRAELASQVTNQNTASGHVAAISPLIGLAGAGAGDQPPLAGGLGAGGLGPGLG